MGKRTTRSSSAADDGWETIWTAARAELRSIDPLEPLEPGVRRDLERRLGQVVLAAREPDRERASEEAREPMLARSLRRLVQRGPSPPVDPAIEEELLRRGGVEDFEPRTGEGEATFRLGPGSRLPGADRLLAAAVWAEEELALPPPGAGTRAEVERFHKWVLARCGREAARWLITSDRLSAIEGLDRGDEPPLDFLFSPPWRTPLVLKIGREGPGAVVAASSGEPGRALFDGLERITIPPGEAMALQGPALERLVPSLRPPAGSEADAATLALVYGPALTTWLTLALAEALERGWLSGETWRLRVTDPQGLVPVALPLLLELVAALSVVHGREAAPDRCELTDGEDGAWVFERRGPATYGSSAPAAGRPRADLEIRLEPGRSLVESLPEATAFPRIVARSSSLPARPPSLGSISSADLRARPGSAAPIFELGPALERILVHGFAKTGLREGQLAALSRLLEGGDTVLRLPPGGGKSQVYLLFGLISEGDTLIVEPGRSRVEVQRERLRRHGFRDPEVLRRGPSEIESPTGRSMAAPSTGRFLFATADRLAESWCQDLLTTRLAEGPGLGLVVLEDAHCLSEWGHDFRPWLHVLEPTLGEILAAAGREPAPMLGLTGSFDREVLRDIVRGVADSRDSGVLIAPDMESRPGSGVELVKSSREGAVAALREHLRGLPRRLGEARERFYAPPNEEGRAGVVLCAEDGEARRVAAELLELVPGEKVGLLCRTPSRESDAEQHRRELLGDLEAFLAGDLALLVAVEGMGRWLDLPKVSYQVFFGLPSSIEVYREEEGRAGHEGTGVFRSLVYGAGDESALEPILDPATDSLTARSRFGEWSRNRRRGGIQGHLERHFAALPGPAREEAAMRTVLEALEWGTPEEETSGRTVRWTWEGVPHELELALYRLVRLGVLRLFHHDSDRGEVVALTRPSSRDDRTRVFLDWVEQLDPGARAEIAKRTGRSSSGSRSEQVLDLAKRVLGLVYAQVEPARRGSLRRVWRWTRSEKGAVEVGDSASDPGADGLGDRLRALLESGSFQPNDWISILGGLLPGDAEELSREIETGLESHPGHPGLLLARAVERVSRGEDRSAFTHDLDDLLVVSNELHRVSWEKLAVAVAWLARKSRMQAPSWAAEVWLGWDRAGGPGHLLRDEEMSSLRDPGQTAGEAVIVLARRLVEAGAVARSLEEHCRLEGSEL